VSARDRGDKNLPATVEDRSIIIEMRRRHRGERTEPARRRRLKSLAELAQKCARWAADNMEFLRDAEPTMPDALEDRAADNWEILVAIADLAGGQWTTRARAAALALSAPSARDNESLGVELLRDIKNVFETRAAEAIGSTDLVTALVALDSRPWAESNHGRRLTAARLARMLKDFQIYKRARASGSFYQLSDFQDAFERYLTTFSPDQASIVPLPIRGVRGKGNFGPSQDGNLKSEEIPTESEARGSMEVRPGGMGDTEVF